jgi:hypothetical protein
MRPTTTIIKRAYRSSVLWLYRRSLESEFASILGIPVLFTSAAPYLWAVAISLVLLCGFAGWLEGGAL